MKHIRLISSVYEGSKNPLDYLEQYEFSKLTYLQQYHLILLVALARRQNRLLPNDPIWLRDQLQAPEPINVNPYIGIWFEKMKDVEVTYDKKGYFRGKGTADLKHGDKVKIKGLTEKEVFNQDEGFVLAWKQYPAKIGKIKAWESYKRMVKSEKDHGRLMGAMVNYVGWIKDLRGRGNNRPMMDGKTFFNNWEADYENFIPPENFSEKKESFQEAETRKFLENEI